MEHRQSRPGVFPVDIDDSALLERSKACRCEPGPLVNGEAAGEQKPVRHLCNEQLLGKLFRADHDGLRNSR